MTRLPSFVGSRAWLIAAAAVAVVALVIALAWFLTREPHLPLDSADGKYAHDCCGTIELRGGEMLANGRRWVTYTVEEDEIGPYVLPDRFVGSRDQGVELDSARPIVKLRLDRIPRPNNVLIPHLTRWARFERKERFRHQPPPR